MNAIRPPATAASTASCRTPTRKPIADVIITLSGKATAETKTAADGKGAFSVADDGDYTVTIDASVAKEHGLKANSATVTIRKSQLRQAARSRPIRPGWRFHRQRHVRHIRIVRLGKRHSATARSTAPATQAVRRKRDDVSHRSFAGGTRVGVHAERAWKDVERRRETYVALTVKSGFFGELKRGGRLSSIDSSYCANDCKETLQMHVNNT